MLGFPRELCSFLGNVFVLVELGDGVVGVKKAITTSYALNEMYDEEKGFHYLEISFQVCGSSGNEFVKSRKTAYYGLC